jgi:hypothetical protein
MDGSTTSLISVLTKRAKLLHILSLEDDSHNYVKFDTLYKDEQSFHRLNNSTLFAPIKMLHSCSSFWSYHPCYKWTMHTTSILSWFKVSKAREEWINFWLCWCFPTNRAHALDLYLVFMSRTHFKQMWGEDNPLNLQVEVLNQ